MEERRSKEALATRIRIVCGALVGILIGAFGGVLLFGPSGVVPLVTITLAFAFAYLAQRFGDAFWVFLSRALERTLWFR